MALVPEAILEKLEPMQFVLDFSDPRFTTLQNYLDDLFRGVQTDIIAVCYL